MMPRYGSGDEPGTGAGTRREREWGRRWKPVDEHRMETETRAGTETKAVAKMGTGTRIEMGRERGRDRGRRRRGEEAQEAAQEL